jgi:ABC-type branched-subunit amino acid transport system permease subunit
LWLTYYLLILLAVLSILLSQWVKSSKFGLGLLAIREDEDAAEVMGVTTPSAKTWAYVLSAILPGMVGVLFYFKNGNIEPGDAFRLHFSIEMLVMVMLGGFGTVLGPMYRSRRLPTLARLSVNEHILQGYPARGSRRSASPDHSVHPFRVRGLVA